MRIDQEINERVPIIPHESVGADYCGCLVVRVNSDEANIVCNECGSVVWTVPVGEVETLIREMSQTGVISSALCTHCAALNTSLECLR